MPQGSVRAVLVAKVDELVDITAKDLAEIRAVTEQLHPERAHSCATAIEMAEVAASASLKDARTARHRSSRTRPRG